MYYQSISQCTQNLHNLEIWLDKAEQLAAAKEFDVDVLMTSRLAPDMKAFIYQVQSGFDRPVSVVARSVLNGLHHEYRAIARAACTPIIFAEHSSRNT